MAGGTVESALAKGAIGAVSKVPWYKIWSRFAGNKICIYGPAFAGKSELYNYIRTGKLRSEESANEGTPYFTKSGATKLTYEGDHVSNDLMIRYTQDSPGGAELSVIVADIKKLKPNFIFVVLDASNAKYIPGTRYGGAQSWFGEFANKCSEANDIFPKVSRSLRGMSVIWNKCDKLDMLQLEQLDDVEREIRAEAAAKLQRPLGVGRNYVSFSRCCLIAGRAFPHDGPAQKSQHQDALEFMLMRLKK